MKRILLLFVLILLATTAFAQVVIQDTGVVVDRPAITITTATADTATSPSASAHSVIVSFKFGTVVGSYTGCTVQAKTSIDGGTTFLTLSTPATLDVSTGTSNAWTITDAGPASGHTSSVSPTASLGFGQSTKFTFACSGYGTSAPVAVTTIYQSQSLGGGGSGGSTDVSALALNSTLQSLIALIGTATDDKSGVSNTSAATLIGLLKNFNAQLQSPATATVISPTAANFKATMYDVNGNAATSATDPCFGLTPVTTPFGSTGTAFVIVAAVSGKINYGCGGIVVIDTDAKLSILEGSGSSCGTSPVALIGSTTGANGVPLKANTGFMIPNLYGKATNKDWCLLISTSALASGSINVLQP